MKKMMFNDKYCLTEAVLNGNKTMTRRNLKIGRKSYQIGEIIAVAQSYLTIGNPQFDKNGHDAAGNTNKMFVNSKLMMHHIRITDYKIEHIQDISYKDCLREGIMQDTLKGYYYGDKNIHKTFDTPKLAYQSLIEKLSGKDFWNNDPYVIAYSFELID